MTLKNLKEISRSQVSFHTCELFSLFQPTLKSPCSLFFSLYQAMALWIEESRLHDPNLFLDALPDVYKSGDLTKIFQGDQVGNV